MFNFFQSSSDPAVTPGSVNDLPVPGGPSPDRPAPSTSTSKPAETAPPHASLTPTVLADTHTHDDDQNAVSSTDPQLDLKDALAAEDGTSRAVDDTNIHDSPTSTTAGADVDRQPSVAVGTAPPKQSVVAAMAPAIPEVETPAAERSAPAPTAVDFEDSKPVVHPSAGETAPANGNAAPMQSQTYVYVPANVPRHQLSDPPVQQDPKSILRSSSPTPTNNTNNVYAPSPTKGSHSREASIGKFSSTKRNSRVPSPTPGSVTSSGGAAARRAKSVRSVNTNGEPINGSTFVDGAATAAPLEIDPTLHERQATAEEELSSKEKAKLEKQEAKHGRQLSVIIKQEGKAEKQALDVATKELAEVQKLQKVAIKDEGKSHTAHARALAEAHKAEMAFLAAQALHEKWQANLRSAEETLEASREHARRTTEMLREKNEEVEHLRATKQVDDRERLVKMKQLNGGEKGGISRIFGM